MRESRKVFRLFSRLNIGGPALHVVNLSVGLKRFGYQTTLVVGKPEETEGSLDKWAKQSGANLLSLSSFQAPISPRKDFLTFVKLVGIFLREKPGIVHTHTFKAGVLGRLAAWLTGVPVIVHTYHGHLLSGYWGKTKTEILRRVESFLSKITTQVIAVSPQVASDLIQSGVVHAKKTRVIGLGFDIDGMERQLAKRATLRKDLSLSASALVVGVVGRLVPVKGIDLFLAALAPLTKDFSNLHLAIIGDGANAAELKELAQKFDTDRIHFCGWRLPVIPDLKDLDLCVCSSRNEGTSVSIIEAVIAGVPIVSTRVGGMPDLLEQGRWGDLADFEARALREAVRKNLEILSADGPSRTVLKERTREASKVFKSRFSMERLVKDIDSLYRDLLKAKGNQTLPYGEVMNAQS